MLRADIRILSDEFAFMGAGWLLKGRGSFSYNDAAPGSKFVISEDVGNTERLLLSIILLQSQQPP